ncbi:unnamed protein product [Calicophoron daubneyi]|uniref:Enkurin domain-containing protein n=1 Tax=Calicophoron daubneyi TaxID=300641 RepID=A0AAV2TFL6_CALDB
MTQENILNLIYKEPPRKIKSARYASCFRPSVINEYRSNKHQWKSIGQAKVPIPDPKSFLKRRATTERKAVSAEAPRKGTFHECGVKNRKPKLPNSQNLTTENLQSDKNYVAENLKQALRMVPRRPAKYSVDTRLGHKIDLEKSGLELVYIQKENLGDLPEYISKRRREVDTAIWQYNQYVEQMQQRNALKKVADEEKKALLKGLKDQWLLRYKQYQTLSVMIDTAPQVQRKMRLEKEMSELENDIELIERYQVIYIAN